MPRASGGVWVESNPETLVEQYLPLVDAIAKKILKTLPSFVELDDLVAFGRLGLIEASRRFDPTRGVTFKTFGYYRIRGAIYDGIRKMAWFKKPSGTEVEAEQEVAVGVTSAVTFQAAANEILSESADQAPARGGRPALEDDIHQTRASVVRMATARLLSLDAENVGEIAGGLQTPEETMEMEDTARLLRECLDELDEKERAVVEDYYFHHLTLEEAGAKLGLSKSWTSRVHARALKKLGDIARKRGLEAPP